MPRGCPPQFVLSAGDVHGKWTVVDPTRDEKARVLVRCACGKERRVWVYALVHGKSRSCQSCANRSLQQCKPVFRVDKGDRFGIWTVVKACKGAHAMVPLVCDRGHAGKRRLQRLVERTAKYCKGCAGARSAIALAKKYVLVDGKKVSLIRLMKHRGGVVVHATKIELVSDREVPPPPMSDEDRRRAFYADHKRQE